MWLWVGALAPLAVLLLLLVGFRWPTVRAALAGLAVALLGAWAIYGLPLAGLVVAAGKGLWDAVFVLYVVWPALLLYHVTDEAGAFLVVRRDLARIVPSCLLRILGIGWALASLLQGAAGFGTPIAVVAPLLLGLGVRPIYATALALIGAAWANMFGSLGVPWFVIVRGVALSNAAQASLYTAGVLLIPDLAGALYIAWLYGRGPGVAEAWPGVLAVWAAHGLALLLLVGRAPAIAMLLASLAGLGALFAVAHLPRYRAGNCLEASPVLATVPASTDEAAPPLSLGQAFLPYYVLIALVLAASLVPPVASALGALQVGLPFPGTASRYGQVQPATPAYAPFAPLTHPGTYLLVASLAGYLYYRRRRLYHRASLRAIFTRTVRDALGASASIVAFLTTAAVMRESGQIAFLAGRLAEIGSAPALVVLSPFVGVLGVLVTSSATAANILLAPLQAAAAQALAAPQSLVIAGQGAGGATANAASPGDTLVGATTVGVPQQVGEILRVTLPWALATAALLGGALLLLTAAGGG